MMSQGEGLDRLLVKILRHDAITLRLPIQSDGFISVHELLKLKEFRRFTESDIEEVARRNHRVTLNDVDGQLKIKANQGHSFPVSNLDLKEVRKAAELTSLIHLTTEKSWLSIKHEGLKTMRRTHIHFSPSESSIYTSKVPACKVRIYIDTARAMAGGIKFFRSPNNDILSPGNQNGIIPKEFFARVELHDRGHSTVLFLQHINIDRDLNDLDGINCISIAASEAQFIQ